MSPVLPLAVEYVNSDSMQHSDQLERLTQDYQDLQEKFRIPGRELESANQVAQDLAKTMESFEQRALEGVWLPWSALFESGAQTPSASVFTVNGN